MFYNKLYYCKTSNESRDFKVIILDKNNKFCYHMYICSLVSVLYMYKLSVSDG